MESWVTTTQTNPRTEIVTGPPQIERIVIVVAVIVTVVVTEKGIGTVIVTGTVALIVTGRGTEIGTGTEAGTETVAAGIGMSTPVRRSRQIRKP